MQGRDAHVEPQFGPQTFKRKVGLFGDGGTQFGFMLAMEWHTFRNGRPSRNFARGLVASDELTNPFGTGGVFACQLGEGHATLEVDENALTQVG